MLKSILTAVLVTLTLATGAMAGTYQNQIVTAENSYGASLAVKVLPIFKAELNEARNQGHTVHFDLVKIERVAANAYDIHVFGNLPTYAGNAQQTHFGREDGQDTWYIVEVRNSSSGFRVTNYREN